MGIVASSNIVLDQSYNGQDVEVTASLEIYVPTGLPADFGVIITMTSGTATVKSRGGTTLNGATSDITRTAASNPVFVIKAKPSSSSAFTVTGS